MKKLSLIELMITIVVLGLLVSLAAINFYDVKSNAENSKLLSNVDAMTKSSQNYFFKEGTYPAFTRPTVGNPGYLDLEKIYPKYLTKIPSLNYHYYVDVDGNVSASTEKYPEFISYNEDADTLVFEQSSDFERYIISGSVDGRLVESNSFFPELIASDKNRIIKITEVESKKYLTQQEIENFNSFILNEINDKYPNITFEDIDEFYIQGVTKDGIITPYIGESFNPYQNLRVDNKSILRVDVPESVSLDSQKIDLYLLENIAPYYTNDLSGSLTKTIKSDIVTQMLDDSVQEQAKDEIKESFENIFTSLKTTGPFMKIFESAQKVVDTFDDITSFFEVTNMLSNAVKDLDMTGEGISAAKGAEISEKIMKFLKDELDIPEEKYSSKEVAKTTIEKDLSSFQKAKFLRAYNKEFSKVKKSLEKYIKIPNVNNLSEYVYEMSRANLTFEDESVLRVTFEEFNRLNNISASYEDGKINIVNGYDDMNFIEKMNDQFNNDRDFNIENLFKIENINGAFKLIINEGFNFPVGYKIYVSNSPVEVKKDFLGGFKNEPLYFDFINHSKGVYYGTLEESLENYLKSAETLYYTVSDGSKTINPDDWNEIYISRAHDYHTAISSDVVYEEGKAYYVASGYIHDTLSSNNAVVIFSFSETPSDSAVNYVHHLSSNLDEYWRIVIDDYNEDYPYHRSPLKFSFKVVEGFSGSIDDFTYETALTPWIEDSFPGMMYTPESNEIQFSILVSMQGYPLSAPIIKDVPLVYDIVSEETPKEVEWEGNIPFAPKGGTYTVNARVKGSDDQWGEWQPKIFTVLNERLDKYDYKDNYYSATLASGSVYVLSSGELRLFGNNTVNALGVGHMNTLPEGSFVDISLPNGEKAKNVFTSSYSVLVISESGKVYGFGKNTSYSLINSTVDVVLEPTLVFDPTILGSKAIKAQITDKFTMILLDNGDLYFRGTNVNNIAGPNTSTYKDIVKLDFISNLDDFDTMGQFVVAIDKTDEVFAWGRNYYNVFENSSISYSGAPISIMNDGWIVKAGDTMILIIDRAGNVIAKGEREVTINGVSTRLSSEINAFNVKAKYIESGMSSAYIISHDGKLYTFGQNNYGQLAHGSYNTGGTALSSSGISTAKMLTSNKSDILRNIGNYTDRQRALGSTLEFENVKFVSKEVYMAKVIAHTNDGKRFASGYNGTKNYLGLYTDNELDEFLVYGGKRDTPSHINVFVPVKGLNQ